MFIKSGEWKRAEGEMTIVDIYNACMIDSKGDTVIWGCGCCQSPWIGEQYAQILLNSDDLYSSLKEIMRVKDSPNASEFTKATAFDFAREVLARCEADVTY